MILHGSLQLEGGDGKGHTGTALSLGTSAGGCHHQGDWADISRERVTGMQQKEATLGLTPLLKQLLSTLKTKGSLVGSRQPCNRQFVNSSLTPGRMQRHMLMRFELRLPAEKMSNEYGVIAGANQRSTVVLG